MISTAAESRTWKLAFQRQRKIEQEERRNGGQPRGDQSFLIDIMLPYLWLSVFLRSSVPLVQSRSWLFCAFGNFPPMITTNSIVRVLLMKTLL